MAVVRTVVVAVAVLVVLAVVVADLVVVVGEPEPELAKAADKIGMYALYAAPLVGSRPYM